MIEDVSLSAGGGCTMNNEVYWEGQKSIAHIIDNVATRGWLDNQLQTDDFAELRLDKRYRDAQIAELYEQYFLPERHEFEWHILSEIITTIIHSPVTGFVVAAVTGGVLGNAAYDLIKKMCLETAELFEQRLGAKARERAIGFRQLATDAEKIKNFFSQKQKARIEEIERETGINRERIYPLMKLAGLKHYRRDNPCYWEMSNPESRLRIDKGQAPQLQK
jgi:hypothetical protein